MDQEKRWGSIHESTENEIAMILASWTNIPVQKLKQEESEKLLKLEEILHARVIVRTKRLLPFPKPSGAPEWGLKIQIVLSVPSSSWGRQVSAKLNCVKHLPKQYSDRKMRLSVLICPNI